jgi:hypothetical protein
MRKPDQFSSISSAASLLEAIRNYRPLPLRNRKRTSRVSRGADRSRKDTHWGKRKLARDRSGSFPQVKLQAQAICDFFHAPLIADGIARRRNHRRLPPESMIFANANIYLADAQRADDHIG